MLKLIKNKEKLNIEYTRGDTFKVQLIEESNINVGRRIRFQVSKTGDDSTLVINKMFSPIDNRFDIELTASEADILRNGQMYEYRITYFETDSSIITTYSGTLNVVWGTSSTNSNVPDVPAIAVSSGPIEKRLQHLSEKLSEVSDISDENVEKLETLIEEINEVINSIDGKVDKQKGKQLSTEDYTTSDKIKLSVLPSNFRELPVDTDFNDVTEPGVYLGSEQQEWNGYQYTMPYLLMVSNHQNYGGVSDYATVCQIKLCCGDSSSGSPVNIIQWRAYLNYSWTEWKSATDDSIGVELFQTVDQEYNPESANAQSGVAVAEAIAKIPTGSEKELIMEYVHTSNQVYQPTAFDKETGIFTCVGHGISTPTKCVMVMNNNLTYDAAKLPNMVSKYWWAAEIVRVDDDTFKINDWDITTATNLDTIDVASFHFEAPPKSSPSFAIMDIPVYENMHIEMLGRGYITSWWQITPSMCVTGNLVTFNTGTYASFGRPGYGTIDMSGMFYLTGDIHIGETEVFATRETVRCDTSGKTKEFQKFVGKYPPYTQETFSISHSHSGEFYQCVLNGFTIRLYKISEV